VLLVLAAISAVAQMTPSDSTTPNQYYFVSADYFSSQGTTNAVITVRFLPGSRMWSGSVNFSTSAGTAVANEDYIPVNGTLSFSGTSYGYIIVPVSCSTSNRSTVLLSLTPSPSDAEAMISRSNATLTINLPPPPDLKISPGPYGTVTVWWPHDGTDVFVEKLSPPGTNWITLFSGSINNGIRSYTDVPSDAIGFYRLRRPQ
jgi:hypothetical protein